jgi:ribonuclease HII
MGLRDSERGPSFELEAVTLRLSGGPVAGVDEAGRGPWAGPVVAAAVILNPDNIPEGIDDSKALNAETREALYAEIAARAQFGVGIAEVARIDRINILQATLWAMRRAVAQLKSRPKVVLVDGDRSPRVACECRTVVGGDALCVSIAAASIIAKVTRDRLMIALARECPGYGFERHKGYGTPEHQEAVKRLGVSPHHRRTWRPTQLALGLD